jgi:hypothetical protein
MRMPGNTNCSTLRLVRTEASQSRSFIRSEENSVAVALCTHMCISGFAVRPLAVLLINFYV